MPGSSLAATSKKCRSCDETKLLREGFYRDVTGKDGFSAMCRECIKLRVRQYNRSPKGIEKRKQWVAKNVGRLRQQGRSEKRRAYRQKYRSKPEVRAKELAYSREYESRPETRKKRAHYQKTDAHRESQRRYYTSPKGLENYRAYRESHITKALAREILNRAIHCGKMKREPCSSAADTPCRGKIEGHHHSYKREDALNVSWLCRRHHRELHEKLRTISK